MVLDFGWRIGGGKTELVTWSKDCTLRLWDMDSGLLSRVGQEVEVEHGEEEEDAGGMAFMQEGSEEVVVVETVEEEGAVIVASPLTPSSVMRQRSGDSDSEDVVGGVKGAMNLNYEFKLVSLSEKLEVMAQDSKERLFTVSAETGKNLLILHVKFPPKYPNKEAPVFSFLQGTTIDSLARSRMMHKIRGVAKHHINRNRRCLEPCLRQFEAR